MSKEYKYTYRFSEQTVDTRYYKVESNKKLTYHEMQDIAWSAEQLEGSSYEMKMVKLPLKVLSMEMMHSIKWKKERRIY